MEDIVLAACWLTNGWFYIDKIAPANICLFFFFQLCLILTFIYLFMSGWVMCPLGWLGNILKKGANLLVPTSPTGLKLDPNFLYTSESLNQFNRSIQGNWSDKETSSWLVWFCSYGFRNGQEAWSLSRGTFCAGASKATHDKSSRTICSSKSRPSNCI